MPIFVTLQGAQLHIVYGISIGRYVFVDSVCFIHCAPAHLVLGLGVEDCAGIVLSVVVANVNIIEHNGSV